MDKETQDVDFELTAEAHFWIEKKIQDLRLFAMSLAISHAAAEQCAISRDDASKALKELAETGLEIKDHAEIIDFPVDVYTFLDKQLSGLRMEVANYALKSAEERRLSKDEIERAWNEVVKNPSILRSVLVPE
jgi:hypothetical protein